MILSISGSYKRKGFTVFRPTDKSCWLIKKDGEHGTEICWTRKEANAIIDARQAHAAARRAKAQEVT